MQQSLESCSGLGTTIPQLAAVRTVFLASFHKQHRWSHAQPEALLHLFRGKGHGVVWVVQAKAFCGFDISGVWQTVPARLRGFSTACCHDVREWPTCQCLLLIFTRERGSRRSSGAAPACNGSNTSSLARLTTHACTRC